MNLAGARILVTGATGGIGGALARALARAGARLVVHGRDGERMRRLLATLPAGTTGVLADLATPEGRSAVLAEVQSSGALDAVVLNAAGGHFGLYEAMSAEKIVSLIQTDLLAPMLLAHAVLPVLRQRPGSALVLVGSTLGQIGHPGFAAYGAAKGGLRTFAEALSREIGSEGPRVLHVSPRATRTGMNSAAAQAMNRELKVAEDAPEVVAAAIVDALARDRPRVQLGLAEKLFVRVNAVLPGVVDRAMAGKLSTIRRHAAGPTPQS